ncbi:hypothetical protein [Hymenobacter cellulosivorans]|uniref:Uncharacterized protein n=1 Tax=Hymenobacter cellulosivorans TaxID=2932249 RepID=A0ABY4F3J6_9BACT|nr:hypothetical protein [Hymenobacter cellulosivorans]UOQ51135.1 hypothetical protein MUN80_15345 [Hymenobacter cellulosivorans]
MGSHSGHKDLPKRYFPSDTYIYAFTGGAYYTQPDKAPGQRIGLNSRGLSTQAAEPSNLVNGS